MTPKKAKPQSISEYIAAAPPEARAKLRQLRACIGKAAPGATEGMKWSMPAFSGKRILVMFAAFKDHVSLFPTPSPIKALAKDLAGFKTSKGAIQFPLDKPLPLALIRRITQFRVRESSAKDAKWRS
jgi:uncharacterized protein YdhG (YjbR/CyaY superfamily)